MPIYQSELSGSYTWANSLTKNQLCRKCPEDVMLLGTTQGVMISEAPGENPSKAIRESTYSAPSHVQHFTASCILS